jgi:hypothetical protein
MAPALAERGVNLTVETIEGPWDEASAGYKIRINGIEVDLYRFDPDEPNVRLADDPWIDCTLKPLAVANSLLMEAGARDRVAVISAGGTTARRSCSRLKLLPFSWNRRHLSRRSVR